MQWRVAAEALKVYVRTLFYEDSCDLDVSDHCSSVKRCNAEVIHGIDLRASLKERENRFRIAFRPRSIQKRSFAADGPTRNVSLVFQKEVNLFCESQVSGAVKRRIPVVIRGIDIGSQTQEVEDECSIGAVIRDDGDM